MTRTEKVREAVKTLASMYAAWPTGPAAEGQPMPEGLTFSVSLKAVLEAREALSLLDGCVIVPRTVTDDMCNAFLDELYSSPTSQQVWSAMIAASEDVE